MNFFKLLPLEERIVLDAAIVATILHVTNSNDSGPGSLRDAVNTANAHPGQDTIVFDPSVTNVQLTSGPLMITGAVTIDGSSSQAAGGKVAITGAGIDLMASNSMLKNLYISTNTANGVGVLVAGSYDTLSSDVISGNYKGVDETGGHNTYTNDFIGTDVTGMVAVSNSFGLFLEGSGHDMITGNVISGNHTDFNAGAYLTIPGDSNFANFGANIWINTATAGYNTIANNHLGTNVSGTAAIESGAAILSYAGNNLVTNNQLAGWHLVSSPSDIVDVGTGDRGVIFMPGADSNMVSNNLFQGYKNSSGQYVMIANGMDNIDFLSNNNTAQYNVLLGGDYANSVAVLGNDAGMHLVGNVIKNNYMGVDPSGNVIHGVKQGVVLIGSTSTVQGNIINLLPGTLTGDNSFGIFMIGWSASNTNCVISGNTITGGIESDGMFIFGLNQNTLITGNTITMALGGGGKGSQGIGDGFNSGDIVTGNIISNCTMGVGFLFGTNNVASKNYISGSTTSILDSLFSTGTQILNNTIVNPVYSFSNFFGFPSSTQADGITLFLSSNEKISGNVILNSVSNNPSLGPAIFAVGSSGIALKSNLVSGFPVGLALQGGSTATSTLDAFLGNAVGIQLDSGNTLTMSQDIVTGLGKSASMTSYGVQLTGTGNTVSISNSTLSAATYGFSGDSSSNTISLTQDVFALDHYGIFDTSTSGHYMALSGNTFLLDDLNMNF